MFRLFPGIMAAKPQEKSKQLGIKEKEGQKQDERQKGEKDIVEGAVAEKDIGPETYTNAPVFRLRDCNRRIDNVLGSLEGLHISNEGLEALRKKLQKEFEDQKGVIRDNFEKKLKDWKIENDDLNAQNRKILETLKDLQEENQKQAEDNNHLKDKLKQCRDDKEKILNEEQELKNRNRLDAARKNAVINSLQNEIEKLRGELDTANARDNGSENIQKRITKALKKQREELENEWAKISQEMKNLWNQQTEQQYKQYQDALKNIKDQCDAFEEDATAWKKKCEDLEREKSILEENIAKARGKNDELAQKLSDLRRKKPNDNFREQFNKLKADYQAATDAQKTLTLKNENLLNEIGNLEKKIAEFEKHYNIIPPVPIIDVLTDFRRYDADPLYKRRRASSSVVEMLPKVGKKRTRAQYEEPKARESFLSPQTPVGKVQVEEVQVKKAPVKEVPVEKVQIKKVQIEEKQIEKEQVVEEPKEPEKKRRKKEKEVETKVPFLSRFHQSAPGPAPVRLLQPKVIDKMDDTGKNQKLPSTFPLFFKGCYFNDDGFNTAGFVGFELLNKEPYPLELKGFSFTNSKNTKKITIPQMVISPHGILRVVIGKNETDKKEKTDLLWNDKSLWNGKSHEKILLRDSNGNCARLFELEPQENITLAPCFIM